MNFSHFLVLKLSAPELFLTIAALAVLLIDLTVMREATGLNRRRVAAMVTGVGCIAALLWLGKAASVGSLPQGMLVSNELGQIVKGVLVVLAAVTGVLAIESEFTTHVGEFYSLLLLSTLGFLFMTSAEDILMIFVALELASLSLYILAGFHKQDPRSTEAAMKYFLFGGMSAAFTLYGFSLLYGVAGSTQLTEIAQVLRKGVLDPMLATAIVMIFIGFAFKIAAVPLHVWAPDVYQGAPTAAVALVASGSKVASFFVLAKIALIALAPFPGSGGWHAFEAGWIPLLVILAGFSMVMGNLVAIAQSNVKRLLAYSAVAHAGYALLGILPGTGAGLVALVYYVATYALTVVGALAVVGLVEERVGGGSLAHFAGLSRRAPFLSFCLMVFLLSLAGIPPLAGFFGKFYVFVAAAQLKGGSLLWLIILAIAASAVSLYYYLQVLKQVYVAPVNDDAAPIETTLPTRLAVGALALAVLVLGCAPQVLVEPALAAAKAAGF